MAPDEIVLERAMSAASAVVAEGNSAGLRISVSICDRRGYEKVTLRGDGAPWFTSDIARLKARTALAFSRDSGQLAAFRDSLPDVFAVASDGLPFQPVVLAGGVLLQGNGGVLGALGVSGATEDQDLALAEFGRSLLSTKSD